MKKIILPVVSALIIAFVIAGCGKTPISQTSKTPSSGTTGKACTNGTITMAVQTFDQSTCTVKAGSKVTFEDPSTGGGFHILCLGDHQVCKPNPDGPSELNVSGGVQFPQGTTKSYTFDKPGTYTVTCTVHTNMDVTITVQ